MLEYESLLELEYKWLFLYLILGLCVHVRVLRGEKNLVLLLVLLFFVVVIVVVVVVFVFEVVIGCIPVSLVPLYVCLLVCSAGIFVVVFGITVLIL